MSEQQLLLKDVQSKLAGLIECVHSLADRVDNLTKRFDTFDSRMTGIETNIKEIEYEIDNIKKNKATVEQLKEFKTISKQELAAFQQQLTDLQNNLTESRIKNQRDSIANETYSKRFNILIHGLKENSLNVWETKSETEELVLDFLKNALKIENPQSIKFADVHRLPQHPVIRFGRKIIRPVIIKLTNSYDKHLIFSSLKHLGTYNESHNCMPKSSGYVFVTEHLPRALQLQKQSLLPLYKKAKQSGKKASWKIGGGEYALYIDGIKVDPNESLSEKKN